MVKSGTIYYVHCVDAEGPLCEDLTATFQRVKEVSGYDLDPTEENLKRLQSREIDLGGKEDVVFDFVSKDKIDYITSLTELSEMLDSVLSKNYRDLYKDSFGGGYVINWACMDHVGFVNNPRKRVLGYHKIFELYKAKMKEHGSFQDRIYWHYHQRAFDHSANKFGMNYSYSNMHNEILARRIIDHKWFPAVNRPGAHMERADINLWLERWIPFDIANQNMKDNVKLQMHESSHRIPGRMGDWRGAPDDWRIYHPSFFDARKEGELKRYIARCLNINARQGQITEKEIDNAFLKAEKGEDVFFSVTNHDFRNFKKETRAMIELFKNVSDKYPGVKYKWCNSVEAFRKVLSLKRVGPVRFTFEINDNCFKIYSDRPVWGDQPFLAIKTVSGDYYHDNLIVDSDREWTYPLDSHSFSRSDIASVGCACNDEVGNTTVMVCSDIAGGKCCEEIFYNENDWVE